jgi:hypothetical protein
MARGIWAELALLALFVAACYGASGVVVAAAEARRRGGGGR